MEHRAKRWRQKEGLAYVNEVESQWKEGGGRETRNEERRIQPQGRDETDTERWQVISVLKELV